MIGYVTLGTNDLDRTAKFYDALAKELGGKDCDVTVVDRTNYHLFQPLLYQIATASLSPADIAITIRGLFRSDHNVNVLLGDVTGVDKQTKQVMTAAKAVPYDMLVIATGAQHSYFGRDEWTPYAPGLKRIEDATKIRRELLVAFERAELTDDDAERKKLRPA